MNGWVGIGTTTPHNALEVIGTGYFVGGLAAKGTVFGDGGQGVGVFGKSDNSVGVYGYTDDGVGLFGESLHGEAIVGYSFGSNTIHGVYDGTSSQSAVWGENRGVGYGVRGTADNPGSIGVYGRGHDKGVYGTTASVGPSHAGVFGENSSAGGTGIVGVGLASNSAGVAGVGDAAGSTGVYGRGTLWGGYFEGNLGVSGAESFGSTTRQMLNLWGTSYGIGVQNGVLYERGNGFAWFVGGSHANNSFDPGGGTTLMTLNSFGDLYVTRNASVCTLTIRGGCDLAEPFRMSTKEIPKGAVVVIDDENAGQLKLSDRAYDSRVAGIVSGANGINSGISLHQEGVLEGGQNVALSGRVYVLADASSSPIKPGDLLTTSSTPGHAMKVTDHARASGAILGKAMSRLNQGRGMVLVLVSLQ